MTTYRRKLCALLDLAIVVMLFGVVATLALHYGGGMG